MTRLYSSTLVQVAERLLVAEQYDSAQRVIEFLDLQAVEISPSPPGIKFAEAVYMV